VLEIDLYIALQLILLELSWTFCSVALAGWLQHNKVGHSDTFQVNIMLTKF